MASPRMIVPTSMAVLLILAAAVGLNVVSASAAAAPAGEPVVVEYEFAAPAVVRQPDQTDRVTVPGLKRWGAVGAPVLPYRTCSIVVPYGFEPADVTVQESQWVRLPGKYSVEAGRQPLPLSRQGPIPPVRPDPAIYGSRNPFPHAPGANLSVQRWRGYAVVMLNLFPMRYLPAAGELQWCRGMRVRVEVRPRTAEEIAGSLRVSSLAADNAYLRKHADNPELLASYAGAAGMGTGQASALLDPNPAYDYIVITSEALAGATGAYTFQDLIAHKQTQGIAATLVTSEWIYANYSGTRPDGGSDNQTRIRNFIKDAYLTWGTHYVLLGGDGDGAAVGGESGDEIIPHRGFSVNAGFEADADIPADMYYGCLDGTFDADGDGLYGEPTDGIGGGEVDLLAEVHVGRAAVDSEQELSDFVAKTLAYASAMPPGDVWMVGEYLGFGGVADWGGNYKDEIKDGSSAYGYTTVGFLNSPAAAWCDVYTLYDRDDPSHDWPASTLIGIINGGIHIINHLGHANVTYVMKLYNGNVDALTNTAYFIGYSQGCYCGAFDNRDTSPGSYSSEDCISEHLTCSAHGAAAFVACSRYGWGVGNSTDGPSQHFDREFWDAVLGENILEIGAANDDSKWDQAGFVSADLIGRWCCYELNVFGDPQLVIKLAPSRGWVALDRDAYTAPATAGITVVDRDLDVNPTAPDITTVEVASTTETTPEVVTCFETGDSTWVFTGTIPVATGSPSADGILQVAHGDTIVVTYHDADDGTGSPADAVDQAVADLVAPVISDVQAALVMDTRAVITWVTDEDATSKVDYGTAVPPGTHTGDLVLVKNHTVTLTGLTPLTKYYFGVVSEDAAGNAAGDDHAGAYYSFTTAAGPEVIYSFPLDTNPGWTCQGAWAFGQPTGKGSSHGDPTSGHTGANVYGYNLNGDYTNNMPARYLTTGALDCTGYVGVELRFWRWLGVESSAYDHVAIEVSNNGSAWVTVWDHVGESFCDSAWARQVYDISAVADGEPTVYVRWKMGPTDDSVTYPGWNIDDVEIWAIAVPSMHHFAVQVIPAPPAPQGGDLADPLPFLVHIEARDASDALLSSYGGTAALTASAGTASPSAVPFAGGVWEGEVTILADLDPDCTLTVEDLGIPASGTSAVFALRGKGDVNADGAVNVLDVMKCVNLALGNPAVEPPRQEYQLWAADMNRDYAINVLDVIQVVNKSLGATPGTGAASALGASAFAAGRVSVSLVEEGRGVWAVRVSNATGLAGAQLEIAGGQADVWAGDLIAAAGWQVHTKRTQGRLRVIAFSPAATGLTEPQGVLLRLIGVRGRPRLAGVILSDAAGRSMAAR